MMCGNLMGVVTIQVIWGHISGWDADIKALASLGCKLRSCKRHGRDCLQ